MRLAIVFILSMTHSSLSLFLQLLAETHLYTKKKMSVSVPASRPRTRSIGNAIAACVAHTGSVPRKFNYDLRAESVDQLSVLAGN